jgi:branched-chain amino acid transport system substrate-binding protein
MMRGRIGFAVVLASQILIVMSCVEDGPDNIVFGQAVSLSGPLADANKRTTGPIYKMWIDEVNEDGGLYIKKYDRRIPIKLLQYDDESDIEKMKKKVRKLIVEDEVNFLLPPEGTEFLYEAALIANKNRYILMGGAGGSLMLKQVLGGMPYFFTVINFADTQMPVLADIMEEVGVESAAIFMKDSIHGVEYSATLVPELALRDIDVVMVESYNENEPDLATHIMAALSEANELEADAFLGFTYPIECFIATGMAMYMGYNPKLMQFSVGPSYGNFSTDFGAEVVDGIMGPGAWNKKSAEEIPAFVKRYNKLWEGADEPIALDYWGHLPYYAGMEFLKKAIEKAGTLEQDKIRDIIATETFDTTMGPVKFEQGKMLGHVGQMGQWQNGVFEVIGPKEQRTAKPLYPKSAWPEVVLE